MALNKAMIIGNLGRDPEEKRMDNGGRMVNLAVATTEKWTDKSGQRQERTEWHRVVIWNEKLGDLAMQYLTKGSKIYVEGKLQTRKFQNKDGIEMSATEIVLKQYDGELRFLGGGNPKSEPEATKSVFTSPEPSPVSNGMDDNIPF